MIERTYRDVMADLIAELEVLAEELCDEGHGLPAGRVLVAIRKIQEARDVLPENCPVREAKP